jgi:hypothetical protein
MNVTPEQIEQIIREVLTRLLTAGATAPVAAGNELALTERLVTLRDIEHRLSGVTKLSVAAKTVVTPSVRDLLRQKKIELVRRISH